LLPIAALLLAVSTAFAASGEVQVQLNKLEPEGGACHVYVVLENGTGHGFEVLKLDLVMFDPEGVVAKRLAVETAPLPAAKTSLKVFPVDGLACDRVGRVLLNDVLACADASGPREDCLGLVRVRAREPMEFIK